MIRTPEELFARAAVCKELLDSKFNGSDGKIYLMICGGGGCVASGALKLEEECNRLIKEKGLEEKVADKEGPRTLIIISNNMFHTERRDVLFMYDVAYENLREVEHIVIVGKRRYDMAVRLKLADIDMERVQICDRDEDLGSCLEKTEGNIYVMTSSVFSNEDKVLEELRKL